MNNEIKEFLHQYIKNIFEETKTLIETRIKIVRARIRNGKIQRRKRISNIPGYVLRKKGKGPARLVRMSAQEKRNRKLGQRRAKIKRRQHKSRTRMRLQRSLRKRRSQGIR